jgi:hypothetical protein
MRRPALCLLVALPLAGGLASEAGAACAWTARLHATTHAPQVGKRWPITVTTSVRAARTTAYYAFLFKGRQVETAEIDPKHAKPGTKRFSFVGGFRDPTIVWPRRSLGIPLTFRVVLKNRCGTRHLDYAVTARR